MSGERWRAASRLAKRQWGLVTRRQLRSIGLDDDTLGRAVAGGRLRRVRRGVYLVGLVEPHHLADLAAVVACQPAAYLSHTSAGRLYALPLPALSGPPDVTVAGRDPGRHSGIRIHRTVSFHPSEVGALDGIPITSPARTLLDLAPATSQDRLERLLAEAYAQRLCTSRDLRQLIARHPGRPGAPALRALLDDGAPAFTRSQAERRLLALLRRADLPPPEVNATVGGYEVDFLWRRERLVVEVDGHAFHAARPQRERDSRRDQDLVAAGYIVLRVTWRQITGEPEALVARIAAALVRAAASGERRAQPFAAS